MATPENQNISINDRQGTQESPVQRLFSLLSQTDIPEPGIIAHLQTTLTGGPADPGWIITDRHGDTLLHKAAKNLKPQVTKFLLTQKPELAKLTNHEGLTPLKALHDSVDSMRHPFLGTFYRGPPFAGFLQSYIFCVAVLTNQEPVCNVPAEIDTNILSNLTWTSDDDIILKTLRIKYGCTCGHCIAGFLSPKMRYALSGFAREYMFEFDGPSYFANDAGSYLPDETREMLRAGHNPAMREAFRSICDYIGQLCAKRNKIPSATNVMAVAQAQAQENPQSKTVEVLEEFFKQGGTIGGVAKEMFEVAGIYFETVDDEFQDPTLPFNKYLAAKLTKGKSAEPNTPSKMLHTKKRPRCANDKEIHFIIRMCGY
ncbi:hypothetical protein V8F06_010102 [Rhypophila decipiens]